MASRSRALLTYPAGYEQGNRVPLLNISRGPDRGVQRELHRAARACTRSRRSPSAATRCCVSNLRGWSGYGQPFRFANYDDWGGGDYEDDHDRRGPGHRDGRGGSRSARRHGLELRRVHDQSWIITQTKRFKAASVGAGVTQPDELHREPPTSRASCPTTSGARSGTTFDSWVKHSADRATSRM